MISPPSPFRPLSPRQKELRQRLLGAVAGRDGVAVSRLSLQWVHRQGVEALDPLIASLVDPQAALWWRQQLVAGPSGALEATGLVAAPVPDPAIPLAPPFPELAWEEPLEAHLPPMAATPAAAGLVIAAPLSDPSDSPLVVFVAHGDTAKTDDPAIAGGLGRAVGSPAEDPPVAAQGPENVASPLGSEEALSVGVSLEPRTSSASAVAPGPVSSQAPTGPVNASVSTEEPAAACAAESMASGPQASESLTSESAVAAASAEAEAPPVRRGRLARLRHLVRDCFEEVACTFQDQGEEAEPPVEEAFPASVSPWPSLDSPMEAFSPGEDALLKEPLKAFSFPSEASEAIGDSAQPPMAPAAAIEPASQGAEAVARLPLT
ncbi:MAG: hypothetical protein WBM08_03205, partial [Prochlorococcaceae cyanobacterium]